MFWEIKNFLTFYSILHDLSPIYGCFNQSCYWQNVLHPRTGIWSPLWQHLLLFCDWPENTTGKALYSTRLRTSLQAYIAKDSPSIYTSSFDPETVSKVPWGHLQFRVDCSSAWVEQPALQPEHLGEGGPELGGHEAVEEEVGGAVPQGQQVHHLPHRGVAGQEETGPQHGRQQTQDALENGFLLIRTLERTSIVLLLLLLCQARVTPYPSVWLRLTPLYSETGWTEELWSKTKRRK